MACKPIRLLPASHCRMETHRTWVAAFALPLLLNGCKPDAAVKKAENLDSRTAIFDATPNAATAGSVTGTVLFAGSTPPRIPIDMSQDPACAFSGTPNLSEQVVVEHGKLGNVFVYVKGAPHLAPPSQAVVIDQKGCRFVPHVTAVAAGGTVEFRNSDPTMHNVHSMAVQAGNHSIDLSQGPGAKPQDVKFNDPENMVPVRCNNHPWMNAFVNVSPNTFFAITGPDGRINIPGLPAGTYTLVLVHEKLGEQQMPFTVKASTATAVNTTYSSR